MFKNHKIGHVFHHSSTSRPCTSKRRTALKSARQIGVSTISKDVLTVYKGVCGWMFKNHKIGHVFDYSSTVRPCTSKRRTALKSARQIGVSTISKDVLTLEKVVYGWMFKNHKIGHVFHHSSTHRARTSKRSSTSDSAHRIGLSTRLNNVLTEEEGVCGWIFKNGKIGHVFAISPHPRHVRRNGHYHRVQSIG